MLTAIPFAHVNHLNACRVDGLQKGSEIAFAQHVSDSAQALLAPFSSREVLAHRNSSAALPSPAERNPGHQPPATAPARRAQIKPAHPAELRSMGSCYKKEIFEFHSPTNSAWTPASCLH